MNAMIATRVIICLAAVPLLCAGENDPNGKASTNEPVRIKRPDEIKFKHSSFTFVRIKYSSNKPRISEPWATDFPEGDMNFSAQFQREMGLKTPREGKVLELTDPELKRCPFIYIVHGGKLQLKPEECPSLRRYLLEGGFLMVDGFWGEAEWQSFSSELKRVFPDREPVELSIDHPIFHSYYDIREKPQVPYFKVGIESKVTGVTWERDDAKQARYFGLFDDKGRLMAIFCHNTHLGEGWEREREDQYYFNEFSAKKAYPMGINIVVYALTH